MLINGSLEPGISALDRGLQYGDGLFETLAVIDGVPCLWQRHIQRLEQGCRRLNIALPESGILLEEVNREIGGRSQGVIKIILTRGAGGRGYLPPQNQKPTRLVRYSEWPAYPAQFLHTGVRARLCDSRLGRNPALAGLKTLNRLEQVLARAEWRDANISEGVMRDVEGNLIEGTMSNLFLINEEQLSTPDLSYSGVAGIMRDLVLEQAVQLGLSLSVDKLSLEDLKAADGIFFTNSLIGIWPVREIDGKEYDPAAVPGALLAAVMDHGFRFV
ncbi:MAG: aminodeoxychorismate lyase [Gammaproteobacteria bacterium]|nr:aminodeoxychorismate lyase [Gammaproteobacteria bacterium]